MITRTTIAMDQGLLKELKSMAKNENYRSLSAFVKDVLAAHLRQFREKELFRQMEEDYRKYAETMGKKEREAFRQMEEMALNDLTRRK